jgi:hypothetical protein
MRSSQYSILLVLSLLTQFACRQATNTIKKDPNVAIVIDLERDDKVSVYDIFSEVEVIPLETNKESAFRYPFDKFFVHDNKFYYVLDAKDGSIFVFNKNGIFVKKINKKGGGPGEYSEISDFYINRFTNNIDIFTPRELIIYDFAGENYIETIPIKDIVHYAINLTKDIVVCFNNFRTDKNKMFFFSESKREIIADCFSHPDFIYTKTVFHHSASPFYVYNNNVYFYDAANGDIFTIDTLKMILKPRYQWDFGEHNFDVSLLLDDKDMQYYMEFSYYGNTKYAFSFLLNAENDNYVITRFRFQNIHRTIIYNKHKKNYLLFHEFVEKFQCLPVFMTNEYMYAILSPDYLPMIINENGLNEENRMKLKQIQQDDNCVVIKYKFKNND